MQISIVPPEHVIALWHKVEPHLKEAFDLIKDTHRPLHVQARLLAGDYHLWVVHDGQEVKAATVGYVTHYPLCKTYFVFLIGSVAGEGKEWFPKLNEALDAYARMLGCAKMEGRMRRGWARVAGYQEVGSILQKDL